METAVTNVTEKLATMRHLVIFYEPAKKEGQNTQLARKKFFNALKKLGFTPISPHKHLWLGFESPEDAHKKIAAVEYMAKVSKISATVKVFNLSGPEWANTYSLGTLPGSLE